MNTYKIHEGDCRETLRTLPDNSVDSIVTDPPYGLEFMGKEWDAPWKGKASKEFNEIEKGSLGGFSKLPNHSRVNNLKCENCGKWKFSSNPCKCDNPKFPEARLQAMVGFQEWFYQVAVEMYRVLKPGGHVLSFGGSRTYHRMACAIEDAGFEVRDQLMWVYGSGFPKSHNISKALDKDAGAEREIIGSKMGLRRIGPGYYAKGHQGGSAYGKGLSSTTTQSRIKAAEITAPSSEAAKQWDGWGTALKPAHEPIVLARKPLEGTVAANVLKWGVGGLNIDACRVGFVSEEDKKESTQKNQHADFDSTMGTNQVYGDYSMLKPKNYNPPGRFPANLMHDGSQEVLDLFPGEEGSSAARFFYCPKASKSDRNDGCDELPELRESDRKKDDGPGGDNPRNRTNKPRANHHPTVKPTELVRYLCRLITPQNGTVLDPFTGSGSTGRAAILEGFNFIGCELNPEYITIAEARIKACLKAT